MATTDDECDPWFHTRAAVRPRHCNHGPRCWVELGKPGWDYKRKGCFGCQDIPVFPSTNGRADKLWHRKWRQVADEIRRGLGGEERPTRRVAPSDGVSGQ